MHTYLLHYSPGSPEVQHYIEDMRYVFRTGLPFLKKWTHLPDNYEELYQQALHEMQQHDFETKTTLITAWGNV